MENNKTQIMILAGGQGTRFWPISRKNHPKQFLSISKTGESLIQATARRVASLAPKSAVTVVTNQDHAVLVQKHLPDCQLILEPCARNTAAAIGLAAIKLKKQFNDSAVMVVLSADHAVQDEVGLCRVLQTAVNCAAASDVLVTVGLPPTTPQTAYGYIRRGVPTTSAAFKVARFYEKPNLERAIKYVEAGDYFWNSGMFAWKISSILDAIAVYMPALAKGLSKIEKVIGTDQETAVTYQVFQDLEAISIDFGVLEHATNCEVVIAEDIGWSDVGSWDAWSEHFQKDESGNMVRGQALLIDSSNCVVYSHKSQIAVLGAKDLVIIDSGDAVLICPRTSVQDVKKIVQELQKQGREDLT